jgi:hypothetical protein
MVEGRPAGSRWGADVVGHSGHTCPGPREEDVACIRAAWRVGVQTRHGLAVRVVCSDQTEGGPANHPVHLGNREAAVSRRWPPHPGFGGWRLWVGEGVVLITELALVADTNQVSCSQLCRVAAALQKQATRDFQSIWQIPATVDAFDRLEDVPSDTGR